ncbi:MAG: hypothetical protein AB1696_24140 [Planctomycetota bacterium]
MNGRKIIGIGLVLAAVFLVAAQPALADGYGYRPYPQHPQYGHSSYNGVYGYPSGSSYWRGYQDGYANGFQRGYWYGARGGCYRTYNHGGYRGWEGSGGYYGRPNHQFGGWSNW